MAIAEKQATTKCLTYDEYLNEGEITYRYDIVDGVRIVPPAPITLHQILMENLSHLLGQYRRKGGLGRVLYAPLDVLIRKSPLRVRQPDITVISVETYRARNVRSIRGPLEFPPELVVEILSDSDRKRMFASKITDYESIGIKECWIVRPNDETIEVLSLDGKRLALVATYGQGQEVQSLVFADLRIAVAEVFAD